MRPVVVTGVADDAPLMAEEQFCPRHTGRHL